LRGKPVKDGEGWIVQLLYVSHIHDLTDTLVGHPYAGRLTDEEKTMLVDMTKSAVKPRNSLLTLKEHNENNVMTINQVYNVIIVYRRSQRGHRTYL